LLEPAEREQEFYPACLGRLSVVAGKPQTESVQKHKKIGLVRRVSGDVSASNGLCHERPEPFGSLEAFVSPRDVEVPFKGLAGTAQALREFARTWDRLETSHHAAHRPTELLKAKPLHIARPRKDGELMGIRLPGLLHGSSLCLFGVLPTTPRL
jgi:hypothetical protein